MATRKRLTPIQKAYQQQVKRISKELTELRKLGRPVNQLEKELRQLASKRPTSKGVQKLKKEYSKRKLEHKAGLIREGKKLITKEQYQAKREQRWEEQRIKYNERQATKRIHQQAKEAKKLGLALYHDQKLQSKDYELPEIVTSHTNQPAPEGQPPRMQDLVIDRMNNMIKDTGTNGAKILEDLLKKEIKKYGKNAVTGALEQLPKEYIEEMETVIKYEQAKDQNSKTMRKIAEAIKSEILNPSERKDIANSADAEEEYE